MATRMFLTVAAAFVFCTSLAQAGPVFDEDQYFVIDLVPDNSGPYYGGERVNVDVLLRTENTDWDSWLRRVRFDFSETDPSLVLDSAFTFDFSELSSPNHYQVYSALPQPSIYNPLFSEVPSYFLLVDNDTPLHIGSIGVQLPTDEGSYTLSLLTASPPPSEVGTIIDIYQWFAQFGFSAYEGNIQGGAIDFVIIPEPTVFILMAVAVVGFAGTRLGFRRLRHAVILGPVCFLCLVQGSSRADDPYGLTESVPLDVDSGVVAAPGSGTEPLVVFSQTIAVDGASWMRLHFVDVVLSGSHSTDNASYLRLSSVTGGTIQVLDAEGLDAWANGSAAFNGHAVLSSQLVLGAATWQRACV